MFPDSLTSAPGLVDALRILRSSLCQNLDLLFNRGSPFELINCKVE